MNDIIGSGKLSDYAEAVVNEIRSHAQVMSITSNPAEIIAAGNSLRTAARQYVENVFNSTGWGNVFADLEEHGRPEETDAHPEPQVDSEQARTVSYRARYRLRIHDFDEARKLLVLRSQLRHATYCEDYDQSYTGVISGLAEVDGWRPQTYNQDVVEVVTMEWECEPEGTQSSDHPSENPEKASGEGT